MEPLVAIGVPVYNGEEFLSECLESILNQTYSNWECVIVNNQSTDSTPSIGERFEKSDKRFRMVTTPEFVDAVSNFNNAFKYSSKGKYFKVVCADDWLFPEYLEKMVAVLENNPSAGLCSSYRIDNLTVNCAGLDFYKGPLFDGRQMLQQQLKNKVSDIMGSETTILIRTESLERIERYPLIYDPQIYHSDTALAYELLSISDLGFVFQVLSYTRRNESTFTSQYSIRFRTGLNFREEELFKYKEIFPDLAEDYKRVRDEYGYYLIKRRLRGDRECIEWHSSRLDEKRKFSFREKLWIFIKMIFRKVFRLR